MNMSGPALGVIADDFTGAVMIAGMIESLGVTAPVIFTPDANPPAGAGVLIAATRSRTVTRDAAMDMIEGAGTRLAGLGCTRLAYKGCATFDSTEEGNIGPAADWLATRSGRRPVLLSAGFPRFGSTVHQGYLFYRNRLVTESIKRLDPLTPMPDPDLARFLGRQTPHPVGLISHLTLVQGRAAARSALNDLRNEGVGHVLCDVTDDHDVTVTAELAQAEDLPVVASDPLIVALARLLAATHNPLPPARDEATGPAAILVGSTGPVALEQLAVLAGRHPVLSLDLLDPRPLPAQIEAAADWASAHAGPLAISTATDAAGVARTQDALGMLDAARRAEDLLAGIAARLRSAGRRRFVVAGGETSGAVTAALGPAWARALPEGTLGLGTCISSDDNGTALSLFLKAGKLGPDDILLRAAEVSRF